MQVKLFSLFIRDPSYRVQKSFRTWQSNKSIFDVLQEMIEMFIIVQYLNLFKSTRNIS